VVRNACTKSFWLPILLIGFPGTFFLTFLEMSFTVWLVSDFVFTPFALKLQLKIPPLPLLAKKITTQAVKTTPHINS
jgi:hypothetical protein